MKRIGDSKRCPECNALWRDDDGGGVHIVGIEDPFIYDGVSYWQCTKCETTWDRFKGHIVSREERDRRHKEARGI